MNDYGSKMMKTQAGPEIINLGSAYIDSTFNYTKNGLSYQVTFLEFGTNCPACKRMELVMEEIGIKYPNRVNVVFLNVILHKNQNLIKYFGVAAIPTQVLLDKNGKEFFRHTGYYSMEEVNIENLQKQDSN